MTSDAVTHHPAVYISGADTAKRGKSYLTTEQDDGTRAVGEEIVPIAFRSSEDYGDPTLGEVLAWHVKLCEEASSFGCRSWYKRPAVFGKPDPNHCQEYYEIVQEYSDYERDYVSKGNP